MLIEKQYRLLAGAVAGIIVFIFVLSTGCETFSARDDSAGDMENEAGISWLVPDSSQVPRTPEGDLIHYGKDLIANTSSYLGPKGSVMSLTNGMNCQNCHLEAGTRFLGNNYGAVYATYPKFRARSGSIENIYKRITDCFERSLNATAPVDTNSREVQAIYTYIKWLGKDIPKGKKPSGTGIADLPFLNRAADPVNGRTVFLLNCQRCHGKNGEGKLRPDSTGYEFPPLWGDHSYTTAAGLYRISRLAGYVRFNMPFDAPQNASRLSDEEAWDVAAFINAQPRPEKNFKEDWPDISTKPFDYPFGPYADEFTELQHKFGPFADIVKLKEKSK